MYIYFNESLEPTTIIPHGEILRQGGDLNLYLCFDKEIDGSLFCYINDDKNIGDHKYVPFYNYIEFNKIKDSEITYDLVDGESYYVYKTKFLPDEATQQHGELKISFEIVQGMEYEIIDCEFKIINPGNLLKTSTVVLYVEKTFGYATQNVNISNIEYQDLIRLIGGVAADKVSFSNVIFVTSFDEIVLNESNLNRLFIDRINGNICKVIKKENIFEKEIINLGLDGLNLFLSEKTDETPIKDSDNFVNSGGIFDAIDEIPVVNPIGEKSGLEGIKVDEEEYIIPQTEFELTANEDGKLTNIKIGKESYDVDTLDNLEVSTDIKYGDTKPITGGAVYDALEELPDIEIETEDGCLTGVNYNDVHYNVPLIDFEILTDSYGNMIGLKINGNIYDIVSAGGTGIVDDSINSESTNPVQNKIIYNALKSKVDKTVLVKYPTTDDMNAAINNATVSSVFEDVDSLPDNPDEQKIYRLNTPELHWYEYSESNGLVNVGESMEAEGITVNIIQVSELPEDFEPIINNETFTITIYVIGEDIYGYDNLTGSNTWLSNSELITVAGGAGYGGFITSLDTTNLTVGYHYIYAIPSYSSYINVAGGTQFEFANLTKLENNLGVGRKGTGFCSEVFNNYVTNVASGNYSHAEGYGTTASGLISHAEGNNTTASGQSSHVEGYGRFSSTQNFTRTANRYQYTCRSSFLPGVVLTDKNGTYARITAVSGTASPYTYTLSKDFVTTEGEVARLYQVFGIASGDYSHAEGSETTASGDYSHAEGELTIASGVYSHAEGDLTKASGYCSHSEGDRTTASGNWTHAEGYSTKASGSNSHAEGHSTTASGEYAHAEGYYTIAASKHQHVQGKYNIEDSSNKYAHIVGNGGNAILRSNAHTLDWDGNAWFKGNIRVGGTSWDDATELGPINDSLAAFDERITALENIANAEEGTY